MSDERAPESEPHDRPQPGSGDGNPQTDAPDYGEDDSQDYVDRSKIDFDPADGLYTGTAVEGDSEIPGTGENADSDS